MTTTASQVQRTAERDGFIVTTVEMTPGKVTPEHDHAWDTRGMVLDGVFTIESAGVARAFGPGEVFEVAAGARHCEHHDPAGGRLLIGRRKADLVDPVA